MNNRTRLNNVITEGSLEILKELIQARNFEQARLRLMALKEAKSISDEEIKGRLIQLDTNSKLITEFFNSYERVNSQPPVEPSAPSPLPEQLVGPPPLPEQLVGPPPLPGQRGFINRLPKPKNPTRKKKKNKKEKPQLPIIRRRSSQEFIGTLPKPKNPTRKNKKKSPKLPIIRRRSSQEFRGTLPTPENPKKKKSNNNKKKSPNPPSIRRRSRPNSEKGNRPTKRRNPNN